MPLPSELLDPLSGPNPSGADLRYDAVYDRIKEARREDEDLPQGDWETTRKRADWPLVIQLGTDALATRSKDLQIAAWLAEALLHREGYGGFREGVDLLRSLLERFWDTVYPAIEDGDAEFRTAPLEWVGQYLITGVKSVALNVNGHTLLDYAASRTIPTKEDAEADGARQEERERAIAAGKLPPEDWAAGFDATPKSWYREQVTDLDAAIESLEALDRLGVERFGDVAPSYRELREALREVRRVAGRLLDQKLATDPDAPGEASAATAGDADAGAARDAAAGSTRATTNSPATPQPPPATVPPPRSGSAASPAAGGPPRNRDDAVARVAAAARFIRGEAPGDPASYLMLRGLRWGELRARDGIIDPKLLAAPPTETRTRLKTLLLDSRWVELIDAAEEVMATPYGRGWLDLQRYAITACDGLGGAYACVASGIHGALRSLLAELPALAEMTLMDDTPTANAETHAWLREEGIVAEPRNSENAAGPAPSRRSNGRGREPLDAALEQVSLGQPGQAIELLMRAAVSETSARARFLRRAEAAGVMVEAGLTAVALPILQELHDQIEKHALEDWEGGDTIARPLGLLYRCLEPLDSDGSQRADLYQRICRLDPMRAIEYAHTAPGAPHDAEAS